MRILSCKVLDVTGVPRRFHSVQIAGADSSARFSFANRFRLDSSKLTADAGPASYRFGGRFEEPRKLFHPTVKPSENQCQAFHLTGVPRCVHVCMCTLPEAALKSALRDIFPVADQFRSGYCVGFAAHMKSPTYATFSFSCGRRHFSAGLDASGLVIYVVSNTVENFQMLAGQTSDRSLQSIVLALLYSPP